MDGIVAAVPFAGVELFLLVVDRDLVFIVIFLLTLEFFTVLELTFTLLNLCESVFIFLINNE